jgi:hypothetical protein
MRLTDVYGELIPQTWRELPATARPSEVARRLALFHAL